MPNSLIELYFKNHDPKSIAPGFLAYLANLECVRQVAPDAARADRSGAGRPAATTSR